MNKRRLILASGVANTFEWYDYALFGHFAPIFGRKFFPSDDPSVSLLSAFLAFALGYLMRPIGGIFFGIIGDRFGRRAALSGAVMCMAFPTAAIGLLPTYETIGVTATSLMILVRMLQGLSMGGALTGSISFIVEHSDEKHRGLAGSISMSSICIGILLGSGVHYITSSIFSAEQFDEWAWRIPFIIGIGVFFLGLYIRHYMEETPLFEDIKTRGEISRSPLKSVLTNYWRSILISIFINAPGSVIFYLESIYMVTYLKITRGFDQDDVANLVNFCYVVMALVTILIGWLSDKIGRRKIFVINLFVIISFTPILLKTLEYGTFVEVSIAQIIIAIIAAAYIGPEPALQAELFPTKVRNTALSLSYNTATSLFGGTTPYIMALLVHKGQNLAYSVYYIIGCSLLSFGALYFYKNRSFSDGKLGAQDNG